MDELLKRFKNGEAFVYTLEDGGTGIVVADTVEEAEQKVRAAYSEHGGYENGNLDSIRIDIWEMYGDRYFPDHPDILEIHS